MKEADQFIEEGWFILDFQDPTPIFDARKQLQKQVSELLGRQTTLEEYQTFAHDDELHTDLQVKMTDFYRQQQLGPKVIEANQSFFQKFLGPDLYVQANPYLRMTRPNKPQDNIGFHRDTFYGGSPYELSVLVPFVNVSAESSLMILPGSHVDNDDNYPTQQVVAEDVTKGSAKHQLGFLYAPKLMDPSIEKTMRAIPLNIGQALVFSLAIVHGSRLNKGQFTRWSSDIRVMNALAPVDLSARPDYYKPLSQSPITQAAKTYEYNMCCNLNPAKSAS